MPPEDFNRKAWVRTLVGRKEGTVDYLRLWGILYFEEFVEKCLRYQKEEKQNLRQLLSSGKTKDCAEKRFDHNSLFGSACKSWLLILLKNYFINMSQG